MGQEYGYIQIAELKNRGNRYNCNNEKGYKEHLKIYPNMVELIGAFKQQIKPVFDVDAYGEDIDITSVKTDINKLFPNKTIHYAKREPRETKKGMKYSYRMYVDGVKIISKNIKELIIQHGLNKNNIYDTSIYQSNHSLFLPFTTKKEMETVPPLIPYECSIFDCCASYILEEFEDWDLKMPKKEVIDKIIEYKDIKKEDDDDDEETDVKTGSIEAKLLEYIHALSTKRADEYDDWISMMFCIINICNKHKIAKRKCIEVLHKFSEKSKKYNEDDIDNWIDKNLDKARGNGYGWNYLKHTCIKMDAPEYYEKKCGKTYYMVKKDFEKNVSKCMNPVGFLRIVRDELFADDNPEPFQFLSKEKLSVAYEDTKYWEMEKNKKGDDTLKQKNFVATWLKDEKKICYERIIFKPYHLDANLAKKYYNIYEGTRAELLPVNTDYENIQPILDHIKNVMVNGNEAHYNWLMQYFAQIIQNPVKKTEVCLIFHGKQGCGKNIIIDAFANGVLGKKLSISTANPERTFFGNFNGCTMNKILGVCNEVGNEVYNCMDKLKDLTTAPDITNEKKGVDRIVVENYINIIMTTNNTNPLNISTDDRRIVWFDCSDAFIGNEEYFDTLGNVLQNDENISAFYHYLKNEVQITISNFQKNRPITSGYLRTQQLNLPTYIRWCKDYVMEKQFRKYKDIMVYVGKKKLIYDNYKNWCETNKYTALKRDTFMHHIEDKETGIKKCISDGCECLRFNEVEVNAWLDKQGINKTNNDVEKFDGYDFIDDDIVVE